MLSTNFEHLKDIPHFNEDGRKHIYDIYSSFSKLTDNDKWFQIAAYECDYVDNGKNIKIPIIYFKTKNIGNAIYLTAGIHGEESAGPNALAENIEIFKEMESKGMPLIIYPVMNPIGYIKDWRYPNLRRDRKDIDKYKSEDNPYGYYSIADVGHRVANPEKRPELAPFFNDAINEDTDALAYHVIRNFPDYPPLAHFDFHEDDLPSPYVYSHGPFGLNDNVAMKIVDVMRKYFPIPAYFRTQYEQPVIDGITSSVVEGAIADIFSEEVIFFNGRPKINFPAKSVITLETPMIHTPLEKRTALFGEIIRQLPEYYDILRKDSTN